ncbi:MAG: SDR family oxidoreductase [Planctomycetes bacterium]|nr:SDR family oxidoreductase [Planctomycetota bacterium]
MVDELFDLSGKVALLTGSGSGLGFVIARGLGRVGATVVLNGRTEGKLKSAVAALEKDGVGATYCVADITRGDQIDQMVGTIEDDISAVDILVNNAGLQRRAPLEEMSTEKWQEVIETNLTGAFLVARRVVPRMIERESGKIINMCSLMSEVGRPTVGNYSAAKGGLKMLTRQMALEWGPHNIQANGIGPGYFLTDMTRELHDDPEFNSWIVDRTPAGRWGKPEELVGTAVFLASPASSFVNGQIVYVDGGILSTL